MSVLAFVAWISGVSGMPPVDPMAAAAAAAVAASLATNYEDPTMSWCYNFKNFHWTNKLGGRTGYQTGINNVKECMDLCDADVTCAAFVVSSPSKRSGFRMCYTCATAPTGFYRAQKARPNSNFDKFDHYRKRTVPCECTDGDTVAPTTTGTAETLPQLAQCLAGNSACATCNPGHMLVIAKDNVRTETNQKFCKSCHADIADCETYSDTCDDRGFRHCTACKAGATLTSDGKCSKEAKCSIVPGSVACHNDGVDCGTDVVISPEIVPHLHGTREVIGGCVDHGYGAGVLPESEPDCQNIDWDFNFIVMGMTSGCHTCDEGYEKMDTGGCRMCDELVAWDNAIALTDIVILNDPDKRLNPAFSGVGLHRLIRWAMCKEGLLRTVAYENSVDGLKKVLDGPLPSNDQFFKITG